MNKITITFQQILKRRVLVAILVYIYIRGTTTVSAHYMRSLVTATLVFEYHEQPFWRMVNILNERLDYPLNTEEQDDCYQQLIRDLKRGSL